MNKVLVSTLAFLFLIVSISTAQSKVDKYCQVLIGNKNYILYIKKSTAKISFGNNKELFAIKDTTIVHNLKLVNNLTTETDVLNYMSHLGWSLVNIHSISDTWEVIYFKREFDNSELL